MSGTRRYPDVRESARADTGPMSKRILAAAVAAATLTLPAGALAQAPLTASITAPAAVKKTALKKGVTVKVTCDRACDARLQLAGPIGIVTQQSAHITGTGKVVLKAQPFQIKALKKGQKLTIALNATASDDGATAQASKKLKLR
jgi:hypothetical protein